MYKVILSLKNDKEYQGEGETLLEAMSSIKVDSLIKNQGTITAICGDKKVERLCNASRLQRIFSNRAKTWVNEVALSGYAKFLMSGL